MISSRILFACAGVAMLAAGVAAQSTSSDWKAVITHIPTPSVTLPAREMSTIGCFATAVPLQNYGSYEWQSSGNCQFICLMLDKPVLGLSDGENCWCGDLIPPLSHQVKNSSCNTPCGGGKDLTCGGPNLVQVILSGSTRNEVEHMEDPDKSSSSSTPTPTSTKAPQPTISETPSETPEKKSGPNKAGIAAGVVVGVVGLAAIVGGVIFFLRQKKRREIEEEHRRREANNPFFGGHSSSTSMTDSRLDPAFMDRRQSNGSIADNEDFSRRILKVTNA